MKLDRFARLFEVICLVGTGAAIGAPAAAVRVRSTVTAEFEERLSTCERDRDAHDRFIALVVDDVEAAVKRASAVVKRSAAYARPNVPTDPPTAFAADQWWVYTGGRWEPMEVSP